MLTNKDILTVLKIKDRDVFNKDGLSSNQQQAVLKVITSGLYIDEATGDSEQGYVTVGHPHTGRTIVISKGYDGKTYLYKQGFSSVKTKLSFNEVVKRFDFLGYLNKPIIDRGTVKTTQMYYMQSMKGNERYYKRRIDEAEKLINETQKELNKYKESLEKTRAGINKLLKKESC